MNLKPSEEQQMLHDSLSRLLANSHAFDVRHAALAAGGAASVIWAELAELGVLAAPIATDWGGFDGDAVDHAMTATALGQSLALEPYHGTVVMAATALACMGTAEQRERWLPAIADGSVRVGWAYHDGPGVTPARAQLVGGESRLHGCKTLVLHAADCTQFLVTATNELGEVGLYWVDGASVRLDIHTLVDGCPSGTLDLADAPAQPLDGVDSQQLPQALKKVLNTGLSAVCAEMVGAMAGATALTVEYLKGREQFGRPIGSNQALQHRAVDMRIALEQSQSLVLSLALKLAGRNDLMPSGDVFAAAKVLIGRRAKQLTHEAIQMHGGMGMTDACAVGHYLRRVMVLDALMGSPQEHVLALAT